MHFLRKNTGIATSILGLFEPLQGLKNLSEKDLNATGQEKLRLIDTNYKEMKEAGVNVPMNEDTEMEAFCQLVKPGLTYKTYEEALHTTKKRESSIYEKTNK